MERILVMGSPGSGKSTFARRLSGITGIPVVSLDALFWKPGWKPSEATEFEARLTEAIRLNPNHAEAFTNRGFVYLYKTDNDRAIRDFSQAIRLRPNSDLFANRGLAYFNKSDYDHAIQDYDEAIRLSSSDAELFNNRGIAYAAKSNYDRAIQDYDQAVRLNPNYPTVLNNRGWAYSQKGDRDHAIADYLAALKLKPEDFLRKHVEAALKALGR